MRRKLLLCVSAFHLTAALWSRGQLRAVQEFADDEAGQREFLAFLGGLRHTPIYFLADTLDEDYRFETLPRATGQDQRELLARKLKQSYRNSPFCTAQLIHRDKKGKREDRYFFAALTNSEGLEPWLNLVTAKRMPVVGIYLAPLTLSQFIQSQGLGDRNVLVISRHAAGLRQSFFKNGEYRVSRLTLARPDAPNAPAVSFAEEVRNTRGYLDALNVTHVDEQVTVLILDQDGSLEELETALDSTASKLRLLRIAPEDLAKRLGVAADILRTNRDALPLQLLGKSPPAANLAPPAVTSSYTRMQASRVLYAAAGAAASVALLWMAISMLRASALDDEAQAYALQARGEEARYNEIFRTFPPTPATSEQLRHASEAATRLRASYRTPDAVFQVLAQALDKNPGVALTSMAWKHEPGAQANPPGTFVQSLTFTAELTEFNGDYRAAITLIEQFIALLSAHPSVASAQATKLPVSSSSAGALSGDTSASKTEQPLSATFEALIFLKPGV
ncbi:MAG: hypothetical protein ACKVQA_08105 [Burkholderiales bacterium]